MDLKKLAEPFPAECIEWRIGQCGVGARGIWAKALAYVSARAVMDRLDEVCGLDGWSVSYRFTSASEGLAPGVICTIAVRVGDKWLGKEDGAEQTDFEPFKGGISSALKRAGSAWSIGRYLYDLEAGWAEISEEQPKDPGWRFGETKDKKRFWWKPPQLPDWALPPQRAAHVKEIGSGAASVQRSGGNSHVNAVTVKPAANITVTMTPADPSNPKIEIPKPVTKRDQMIVNAWETAQQLRMTKDQLREYCLTEFKKPAAAMTEPELLKLIDLLQFEMGRSGSDDGAA